jgi:hypothetical protein
LLGIAHLAELSNGLGCPFPAIAGWNMGKIRYSFMIPFWQQMTLSLAPALLPTLAVLIGILTNRYQLESLRNEMKTGDDSLGEAIKVLDNSLRSEMKAGFESQREIWRAELHRVEEVLDARLRHLEER